MEVKEIINFVIGKLKTREKVNAERAKEHQQNPYADRFFRPINYDIDYQYLTEVLEEAFRLGMFVMPKTAEDLERFEMDIYTNFIEQQAFPSSVKFLRDNKEDYYGTPHLARLVEEYREKVKFPYPELRLRVNLSEIGSGSDEEFQNIYKNNGAYCGCMRYTGGYGKMNDTDMQTWKFENRYPSTISKYYVKESRWLKGKINIKLTIPKDMELNAENINKICTFISNARDVSGFEPGEIDISFDQFKIAAGSSRYRFEPRRLSDIENLNTKLTSMGCTVKYAEFNTKFNDDKEGSTKWDFEQLKKANTQIDSLAETIKKNKLSPFEAVLFIAAWSSKNLKYNDATGARDNEINNTIVSAVNNQLVRCVGFSEFANAVLNAAGFDQTYGKEGSGVLFAEKIMTTVRKDNDGNIVPDHCQSMIHIEDPKYNINGNYIMDVNAVNFVGDLTKMMNEVIGGMAKMPVDIKSFSSLCLKNLDEYRALNPDYTIFPYSQTDHVEIEYDKQISVDDINKFLKIQSELVRAKNFDEYNAILQKNNIKYSSKPVKVDGKSYDEYMKDSRGIMKNFRKTQGKAIPANAYSAAYQKILLMLYPELKKDMESWGLASSSIDYLNKQITEFVQSSLEENQFDIGV